MDMIKEENIPEIKTEMESYEITPMSYASSLENQGADFIKCEVDYASEENYSNVKIDPMCVVDCKIEPESNNQNIDGVLDQKSEHKIDEEITDIKTDGEKYEESIHKGVKYSCELCDYKATQKGHLQRHRKSVHERVKYSCELCDYKATQKGHLQRHRKSVHERFKYSCELCDYKATWKSDLERHVKSVHEGIKYNCDLCGHKATRKDHLLKHMQSVHEGIRYNCENCDYNATTKQSLKRHVKSVHEGVKFSCKLCDFKATLKDSLKNHEQSIHNFHKGVFACEKCEYKATRKANLEQHIKSVHLGVKYNCESCEHKASSPSSLLHHIKSVHVQSNKYDSNLQDPTADFIKCEVEDAIVENYSNVQIDPMCVVDCKIEDDGDNQNIDWVLDQKREIGIDLINENVDGKIEKSDIDIKSVKLALI